VDHGIGCVQAHFREEMSMADRARQQLRNSPILKDP
jgi:hypothetical protein